MDHRSTCKVILLYIKSFFFWQAKKNISIFFLYISVFVVKVQCFEDTCVKREIDTDAVVLDVCSVCGCMCMFGHHSVNVCTCNLHAQCMEVKYCYTDRMYS